MVKYFVTLTSEVVEARFRYCVKTGFFVLPNYEKIVIVISSKRHICLLH
jgi:hypothetical protein